MKVFTLMKRPHKETCTRVVFRAQAPLLIQNSLGTKAKSGVEKTHTARATKRKRASSYNFGGELFLNHHDETGKAPRNAPSTHTKSLLLARRWGGIFWASGRLSASEIATELWIPPPGVSWKSLKKHERTRESQINSERSPIAHTVIEIGRGSKL